MEIKLHSKSVVLKTKLIKSKQRESQQWCDTLSRNARKMRPVFILRIALLHNVFLVLLFTAL